MSRGTPNVQGLFSLNQTFEEWIILPLGVNNRYVQFPSKLMSLQRIAFCFSYFPAVFPFLKGIGSRAYYSNVGWIRYIPPPGIVRSLSDNRAQRTFSSSTFPCTIEIDCQPTLVQNFLLHCSRALTGAGSVYRPFVLISGAVMYDESDRIFNSPNRRLFR